MKPPNRLDGLEGVRRGQAQQAPCLPGPPTGGRGRSLVGAACTRPIFYVTLAAVVSELPGLGSASRTKCGATGRELTKTSTASPGANQSDGAGTRQPVCQCRIRWRDPQLLGERGRRSRRKCRRLAGLMKIGGGRVLNAPCSTLRGRKEGWGEAATGGSWHDPTSSSITTIDTQYLGIACPSRPHRCDRRIFTSDEGREKKKKKKPLTYLHGTFST